MSQDGVTKILNKKKYESPTSSGKKVKLDTYGGQQGHWVTVNGRHYFIGKMASNGQPFQWESAKSYTRHRKEVKKFVHKQMRSPMGGQD